MVEHTKVNNLDRVNSDLDYYYFEKLSKINLILTNKCNLSCSYCYEQHRKNFGKFTVDSIYEVYNFLCKSNAKIKTLQFFGGEPLLHKDLILSFLKEHHSDITTRMGTTNENHRVSIVTNGLLLTKNFINEYFSYGFTWLMISLDSLESIGNDRNLSRDDIDHILDMISSVSDEALSRITIRSTPSPKQTETINEFIDELYKLGIRNFVIHPLLVNTSSGVVDWDYGRFKNLTSSTVKSVKKYDDVNISLFECIKEKSDNNCMLGANSIAVDAEGDFSGCYFFTNRKQEVGKDAILGNIFKNVIYTDRYKRIEERYRSFISSEKCRSCDIQNLCFQCPADNISAGNQRYVDNDTCQHVIKAHQANINETLKVKFIKKCNILAATVSTDGENASFVQFINHLIFATFGARGPATADYRNLLYIWTNGLQSKKMNMSLSGMIEIDEAYSKISSLCGINNTTHSMIQSLENRIGYMVMLHILVMSDNYKEIINGLHRTAQ